MVHKESDDGKVTLWYIRRVMTVRSPYGTYKESDDGKVTLWYIRRMMKVRSTYGK